MKREIRFNSKMHSNMFFESREKKTGNRRIKFMRYETSIVKRVNKKLYIFV